MNSLFQDLMRQATRLTRAGQLGAATQAIQRALRGAVQARPRTTVPAPALPRCDRNTDAPADPSVVDGCVFELRPDEPRSGETKPNDPQPGEARPSDAKPSDAEPADARPSARRPGGSPAGEFITGRHSHSQLTRDYKLYIPPGAAHGPRPLVVMLHGCTQDPDDFAAGTAMNERACEQGFFVCYPAQPAQANPSRCWNWFKTNHQQRGRGEPALIASLTQALLQRHDIDSRRVYIAGLSAGGAMAAIVAAAYPEIYAAVGVHSGLPGGSVGNAGQALQLMRSGVAASRAGAAAHPAHVPTIVFHGDQDHTVHPRNGELLLAEALAAARGGAAQPGAARPAQVHQGHCANGRRYTCSRHPGAHGKAVAEHWLVHGGGHAWSGGHAGGSFTDPQGPDASGEMLRFFFEHPRAA